MSDNQVETENHDETAADQLAGTEESQKGTNELAAYDAALAEALSDDTEQAELDDESAEVDEEVEETQETEEEAEEQAEETEEQSEEAGETAEQEETEAPASRKIRFSNPEDLAVAAIAKAKKISLVEAAKIFSGEQALTEHQAAAQEQSQETVETVDSVQTRIEELEDMEAQASTALEFETANEHRKEANKLRNKLMDLKIAQVQEKSRTEANEERKFLADYAANEAEAVKYYPDAAKAGSPLHNEIIRLEAEMQQLGDPLYHSEKKPFALAKQAAKNLGIPMTNPNKTVAKKAVQTRPIQPAGGNARTTTPTTAISKIDQAVASVKDATDYDNVVAELLR